MDSDTNGGLLNWFKTPGAQGLLGAISYGLAGAQRKTPINNIGRAGVGGLLAYNNAVQDQAQADERAQTKEIRGLQIDQMRNQIQAAQSQRNWLDSQNPTLQATQSTLSNGMGPTIDNTANLPKVDPAAQKTWELAKAGILPLGDYIKTLGYGPQKVDRTIEVDDGRGGKRILPIDDAGRPIGGGFDGYVAPVQINQGNRITFAKPMQGATFDVGMSPAERDASARGWAGLNKPTFSESSGTWNYAPSTANPTGLAIRPAGSPGKPLTESQGKAAGYADRMFTAENTMDNPSFQRNQTPEFLASTFRKLPLIGDTTGNWVESSNRQQVRQAQEDWVRAKLRNESGAVIGKDEMDQEIKTYFPQMGDSDAVIRQKAQSRLTAARAMTREAGNAYQPPANQSLQDAARAELERRMGGNK